MNTANLTQKEQNEIKDLYTKCVKKILKST